MVGKIIGAKLRKGKVEKLMTYLALPFRREKKKIKDKKGKIK